MLNKRVKALEKRIRELEDLLGLVYVIDEDGYANHSFQVRTYGDGTLTGELGILKQDYNDRKKAEQPKK